MKILLLVISSLINYYSGVAQVNIDTSRYVVLAKNSMWCPYSGNKHYKTANVSAAEITEIENLLSNCIGEYNIAETKHYEAEEKQFPKFNFKLNDFIISLEKYKRQLIPVINAKGEKEVWVNCFRASANEHPYWKKTVVFVNDGGNYYFNVKINLTTKKYYALRVNGLG